MSAQTSSPKESWQRLPPPGCARATPSSLAAVVCGGVETVVLLLVGLLLAIATVNDVVLNTHNNHRLVADLRTWRHYTGHNYKNVSTEEDIRNYTTTDIVCGNTTPGPPKERVQLCLQVTGPTVNGLRTARGGWYLPPQTDNLRTYRYGCFGPPKQQRACAR